MVGIEMLVVAMLSPGLGRIFCFEGKVVCTTG